MTTTNTINNAVERHNQRMAAISAKHEAELEQKRKAQEKERSEKIRHTNARAENPTTTGSNRRAQATARHLRQHSLRRWPNAKQ